MNIVKTMLILVSIAFMSPALSQESYKTDPAAASARISELKRQIAAQLSEIQQIHSALLGRPEASLAGIGFRIEDPETASGDVTVFGGDGETIHIGCHSETLMKSCPGPCPCPD